MADIRRLSEQLITNVEKVIIGKHEAVELTLIALLCRGHTLIEDVPGVGKTMLAKAFARSLGCSFRRIQFTPDLLPSDITGVSIYNQRTQEFEFRHGPIFGQVVLADEINRATPKTQSALLEAMEEGQITVEGHTYTLPDPFLVLATQNPIEYEGTFPLPEAQLDRFFMSIHLGYPSPKDEVAVLERQQLQHPLASLEPVVAADQLRGLQEAVKSVYVDQLVKQYVVDLSTATRNNDDVYLGASPRGSLALFRASQAKAAIQGRDFVIPDDVKAVAEPILTHRLIINPSARIRNITARDVVRRVIGSVPVPGSRPGERVR
ncbi:MAG: MoxR family ATPase [Chloroflexi bacterium]|nr:MoxR family ATPase [Chloroflexota bacterium]